MGQSIDPIRRFKQHLRNYKNKKYKSQYLYNAFLKYGEDNFVFQIIESDISLNVISEREQYWINHLDTMSPNGYNLTKGGEGTFGFHHSQETKDRLSIISRENGKIYGEKVSRSKKGVLMSEECKQKISNTLKGRTDHIEKAKEGFANYLNSLTDDEKQNLYNRRSENNPKRKEVCMLDILSNELMFSFSSIRKAAQWIKDNTTYKKASHIRIGVVCNSDNTAYGYKWKYK